MSGAPEGLSPDTSRRAAHWSLLEQLGKLSYSRSKAPQLHTEQLRGAALRTGVSGPLARMTKLAGGWVRYLLPRIFPPLMKGLAEAKRGLGSFPSQVGPRLSQRLFG